MGDCLLLSWYRAHLYLPHNRLPGVIKDMLCLFNNGVFTVSNNTAIVGITATTIEF